MMTGQRPFPEDNPAKAIQFHLKGEFPDPKKLIPDLPEALREFMMRACRRNPDERYENLYQIGSDLRSLAKEFGLQNVASLAESKKVGSVFLNDRDSTLQSPVKPKLLKNFVTEGRRVRATLLFTDIVDSTGKAVELGDSLWGNLVENHHSMVRRVIAKFRGNEVETTGDGFVAAFNKSDDAIRCGCTVIDAVHGLGIKIRAGLHFGECEVVDGVLHGITVHVGARVAAKAGPDEVLVTSAVKNAVAKTSIHFTEHGSYSLKGIPGKWNLFAVERETTSWVE
jgi:class 3 adenylate cyclase